MSLKRTQKMMLSPGEVVKELRIKKCWPQSTLSELTGIAVSNLSNIERGRSRLGEERAIILAEALSVKPEFLLFPNGFKRPDLEAKLRQIRKKLRKLEGEVAA